MKNSLGVKASTVSRQTSEGVQWGVFYFASKKTIWCKTWQEVSERLGKANSRDKK